MVSPVQSSSAFAAYPLSQPSPPAASTRLIKNILESFDKFVPLAISEHELLNTHPLELAAKLKASAEKYQPFSLFIKWLKEKSLTPVCQWQANELLFFLDTVIFYNEMIAIDKLSCISTFFKEWMEGKRASLMPWIDLYSLCTLLLMNGAEKDPSLRDLISVLEQNKMQCEARPQIQTLISRSRFCSPLSIDGMSSAEWPPNVVMRDLFDQFLACLPQCRDMVQVLTDFSHVLRILLEEKARFRLDDNTAGTELTALCVAIGNHRQASFDTKVSAGKLCITICEKRWNQYLEDRQRRGCSLLDVLATRPSTVAAAASSSVTAPPPSSKPSAFQEAIDRLVPILEKQSPKPIDEISYFLEIRGRSCPSKGDILFLKNLLKLYRPGDSYLQTLQ